MTITKILAYFLKFIYKITYMFPISDSISTRRFPFITILVIAVTVYVFYMQITGADMDAFITMNALIPSQIDFTAPGTLSPFVTAIFLHGGFLHIISNMWFLWIFGDDVEDYLNPLLYLLLYFAAGIVGNYVQYAFMPDSPIPMIGASGAVAGILGCYYILFPHSNVKTLVFIFFFVTIINISAPIMLGYWFILQLFSGIASIPELGSQGGVAFWAHAGGFLTGVLFGMMFRRKTAWHENLTRIG